MTHALSTLHPVESRLVDLFPTGSRAHENYTKRVRSRFPYVANHPFR